MLNRGSGIELPSENKMHLVQRLIYGFVVAGVLHACASAAQRQDGSLPPIFSKTRMESLDVMVLDKQGRPASQHLNEDDFAITEDNIPQELSGLQRIDRQTAAEAGRPAIVFVLDRLNSTANDYAYLCESLRQHLSSQPAQLDSFVELALLGDNSFTTLQYFTRDKAALQSALENAPRELPYKNNDSYTEERFFQSAHVLKQIALQARGAFGQKKIVWLGRGSPTLLRDELPGPDADTIAKYMEETLNLFVKTRTRLYVIDPIRSLTTDSAGNAKSVAQVAREGDPFKDGWRFASLVNATGGLAYYDNNAIDEMDKLAEPDAQLYTLTYRSQSKRTDGGFRRIGVTLRDPNLHTATIAGYFAHGAGPAQIQQQTMSEFYEALTSTLPFQSLDLQILRIVRHPDTGTVELKMVLRAAGIPWAGQTNTDGSANATLVVAGLSERRAILANRREVFTLAPASQDKEHSDLSMALAPITLPLSRATKSVRAVVQISADGRIGVLEISRKVLDLAPEAPTEDPGLATRPRASLGRP
jgi:VWFA-related protein